MAGQVSAKKQILFPAAAIVDTKREKNRRDAMYTQQTLYITSTVITHHFGTYAE